MLKTWPMYLSEFRLCHWPMPTLNRCSRLDLCTGLSLTYDCLWYMCMTLTYITDRYLRLTDVQDSTYVSYFHWPMPAVHLTFTYLCLPLTDELILTNVHGFALCHWPWPMPMTGYLHIPLTLTYVCDLCPWPWPMPLTSLFYTALELCPLVLTYELDFDLCTWPWHMPLTLLTTRRWFVLSGSAVLVSVTEPGAWDTLMGLGTVKLAYNK